jgi:hypothetical protein
MKKTAMKSLRVAAVSGLIVLGAGIVLVSAAPAEAQTRTRARYASTHPLGDFDRDGIRNNRDPDDDNDRIPDRLDRNDFSTSRTRSSRAYDWDRDGVPNARDRDDDNDGVVDARDGNDRSKARTRVGGWRSDWDRDGYSNTRDRHPRDPRRH